MVKGILWKCGGYVQAIDKVKEETLYYIEYTLYLNKSQAMVI